MQKDARVELIRLQNLIKSYEKRIKDAEDTIETLSKVQGKTLAHLNGVLSRVSFLKTKLKEISVENKLEGDSLDELVANIEKVNTIVPGRQYIKYVLNDRGYITDFEIIDNVAPYQEVASTLGHGYWVVDEHGNYVEDLDEKFRIWGEMNG